MKPTGRSAWAAALAAGVAFGVLAGNDARVAARAPAPADRAGIATVSTVAMLKSLDTLPAVVIVSGYQSTDDGGGGIFTWDPTAAVAEDGCTIFTANDSRRGAYRRLQSGPVDSKWCGARGDGQMDDTAALNRLGTLLSAGRPGFLSAGTYRFTQALRPIVGHNLSLVGDGPASILLYGGDKANPGDLLSLGDGATTYVNANLRGFVIASARALNSGAALRMRRYNYVDLDITVDGSPAVAAGNLHDGLVLDGSSIVNLHGSRFQTRNTGVTAHSCVEVHFNHAFIKSSVEGTGIGVHIGGGCGGIYTEQLTQLMSRIGFLADTAFVSSGNNQFFFGNATFDNNNFAGALFDDGVSNPIGKSISIDTAWFASTVKGHGFVVKRFTDGSLSSAGGSFRNNDGCGLALDDPTMRVSIGAASEIADNRAYGICASFPITIDLAGTPFRNAKGAHSPQVTARRLAR